MKRTVSRFEPNAVIQMQPSKSVLHRALICAALAQGTSEILNFAVSDDITATMQALEALGVCRFEPSGSVCRVRGGESMPQQRVIDCRESGSTLRFLFPLGCDGFPHLFAGRGRLMERPFGPYLDMCEEQGIDVEKGNEGVFVQGLLRSGRFELEGDISSQFVTGLLFALPLLAESSEIVLTSSLESAPYVELTREVMEAFGVVVRTEDGNYLIDGNQNYVPRTYAVEGDFSHAAFFAVAAALAGKVCLAGLREGSGQGDRVLLDILRQAGAGVRWDGNTVEVTKGDILPLEIDVSQIPDLVPPLSVLACGTHGVSRFSNAGRLRMKESDRLSALKEELGRLGADIEIDNDALIVHGTGSLRGGEADSHGDHRIAMALAAASVLCETPVTIDRAEAVSKSAPLFFREWDVLRGDQH